jgi:hypothetical protein
MTVIEPTVPHQEAAVRRQLALFGQTELHQQPTGVSNHPEWHGRSIETFEVDARTIPATLTDPHAIPPGESSRPKPLLVRAFIKGDLNTNDLPETPVQLVVAVNGIIRETGTTFSSRGRSQGFEFMLPQSALTETPANVELYLIDRTQNRMRLRRLETSNKNTGSASDS